MNEHRFSAVLFRYCAPPPPFPPIVGVKHGMSGGFKTKGGGKRQRTATSGKDGSENVPENALEDVSKSGPDNGAMSPVVVNGRYGPILMEDEDGVGENPDRSDEVVTLSTTKISKRKSKRRFAVSDDDEKDDEERVVDEKEHGAVTTPRDIGGGFNASETEHGKVPPSEPVPCGPAGCEISTCETPGETEHGSALGEKEPLETPCEMSCGMEVETPRETAGETGHDVFGEGDALAAATASTSGNRKMAINTEDPMSKVDGHEKEGPPSTAGPTPEEGAFPGAGETVSVSLEPYDLPTPAQADCQRGLGALLEATSALADTFSAIDVIGGVSLARGWDGAASPFAEGGEHFLTVGGSSWVEQDPRVSQG